MKGLVQIIEEVFTWAWNSKVQAGKPSQLGPLRGEFLLGNDVEENKGLLLSLKDLSRHLYITGATGSGKTNTLLRLIDFLVSENQTVCLLDLRGDLVDLVVNRLAENDDVSERLRIIDLRDEGLIPPINPLTGAGTAHSRAYGTLSAIRSNADSWGVQLDEVLRNSLIALASIGGSLVDLPALLSSVSLRLTATRSLTDPIAIEFFERYEAMSVEKQRNLAGPVLNKVTPFLALPEMRKLLSGSPGLDLGRLLNRKESIVLVALAGHRLKEAARLAGSLLLAAIENIVVSRAETDQRNRTPIHLIVDEFENFASDTFLTLLAEGRRYGGRLILAHQNLSQLSREMQDGLRSNAHLQLYFQTGATDAAILAKEISGLGKKADVQELLKTLAVGQALFTERSEATCLLQTPPAPTIIVDRSKTEQLREASRAAYKEIVAITPDQKAATSRRVRHARMPKL